MTTPTEKLAAEGVSIWLDDLSRERITSGNLAALIVDRNVTGVTTNPTIFAGALAKGSAYDGAIRDLKSQGADTETAIFTITTTDVRDAADVFRPVYDATGGVDGRVSIEQRSRRPRSCGRPSTGRTRSSRSPRPRRVFPRSPRSSVRESRSTSRSSSASSATQKSSTRT